MRAPAHEKRGNRALLKICLSQAKSTHRRARVATEFARKIFTLATTVSQKPFTARHMGVADQFAGKRNQAANGACLPFRIDEPIPAPTPRCCTAATLSGFLWQACHGPGNTAAR